MLPAFIEPSGTNFSLAEPLPAGLLSRALCRTASFLQALEPHGAQLRSYSDWWEHDGLHFNREVTNFHDLFKVIRSPRELLFAMPGDLDVFIGIAPMDGRWYLRFYQAWDDEGFELLGRFDLTLPECLASRFRSEVIAPLDLPVTEQDAAAYYRIIKPGASIRQRGS